MLCFRWLLGPGKFKYLGTEITLSKLRIVSSYFDSTRRWSKWLTLLFGTLPEEGGVDLKLVKYLSETRKSGGCWRCWISYWKFDGIREGNFGKFGYVFRPFVEEYLISGKLSGICFVLQPKTQVKRVFLSVVSRSHVNPTLLKEMQPIFTSSGHNTLPPSSDRWVTLVFRRCMTHVKLSVQNSGRLRRLITG